MNEQQNSLEGIAIIGMAGRFPSANDTDALWSNLKNGRESISFFKEEELLKFGIPPGTIRLPNYVAAKGVLEDIDCFDAEFFNYSPREAEYMDPQHRLFMQCAWHALENAGYDPARYSGWIGIYGGAGDNDYLHYILSHSDDTAAAAKQSHTFFGNYRDFMVTKTSYKLNLRGPGITVQTACSTSLVALNTACQALLDYQCDIALAGGCSVRLPQKSGYIYEQGGVTSPDGHCRPFDVAANGTLSGDGVAIVAVKRLEEAIADGDTIRAVIRGWAINNDGREKIGYAAPGVDGQADVISLALEMANCHVEAITYIETHGTGTPLGDPVELNALTRVFRKYTSKKQFCRIGSIKSNLGHLDAAAGVTGVIKTVLALENEEIPASLHFKQANPKLELDQSPFYVDNRLSPWKRGPRLRRAGVSSFGIGGTNAHIILEEAPETTASGESRPYHLIMTSAKTDAALNRASQNIGEYFKKNPHASLADAAYTLQVGRVQFDRRRFVLCSDPHSLINPEPSKVFNQTLKKTRSSIVFMFPGQGARYVNMGCKLYRGEPVFKEQVDRCAQLLQPHLGIDIRDIIHPAGENMHEAAKTLSQTRYTQPVLFTVEYALAMLLMDWGLEPDAMTGHSIGEYTAACLAGVFSLQDALEIVSRRGGLMQETAPGAMLSVSTGLPEIETFLADKPYKGLLSIAAENAPHSVVLSGPQEAVTQAQKDLEGSCEKLSRLHTSHAFHSMMMDACLNRFHEALRGIRLNAPGRPFISNLTGTWITPEQATDPGYWVAHLRSTVRFSCGVATLFKEPGRLFIEVGPGISLGSLLRKHLEPTADITVLPTLPHARADEDDHAFLLTTVGRLWLNGIDIHWPAFYRQEKRRRIPLPLYPFRRSRHWYDPPKKMVINKLPENEAPMAPPGKLANMSDWFYVPVWKKNLPEIPMVNKPGLWLFFTDPFGIGTKLAAAMQEKGMSVVCVRKGNGFASDTHSHYAVEPGRREDYRKLLKALPGQPVKIVYLWGLTADEEHISPYDYYNHLLFLAKALGSIGGTGKIELVIIANRMQSVMAEVNVIPAKSCLLGPCKSIPLEYPAIQCRSIDCVIPPADGMSALIATLIIELSAASGEVEVAYRDGVRWSRHYEHHPLEAPLEEKKLKQSGTYVITGGLGGVGIALAQYLATHFQARLALVGRSEFPPAQTWKDWLEDSISISPAALKYDISGEEKRLEQIHNIKTITDDTELEKQLTRLCCSYAYRYLSGAVQGISTKVQDIKRALAVQERLEKFVDYMIDLLQDNHYVKREADHITFLDRPPAPAEFDARIKARHPGFDGLLRLLKHCADHYASALSGEIPAISVLYPGGSYDFLEQCENDTLAHSKEPVYRQLLGYILKRTSPGSQGRPLRILEIGAGNGLLTWELIAALKEKNIRYYFTDIGQAFVLNARKKAADASIDFMEFTQFDISKNPLKQGFERESFDIIIGMNVVHATPVIEESLFNLRLLLAPNGLLGLVETIRSYPWVDMVWGLTEGWWYFEDSPLRKRSPLLNLAQWQGLLERGNFKNIVTFPDVPGDLLNSDTGLIVAQYPQARANEDEQQWLWEMNPVKRTRRRVSKILQMKAMGAEVEVYSADVSDEERMAEVINSVKQRFGPINGVIHSTLVLKDGMMQFKDSEAAREVMLPKVDGTEVLYRLVRDQKLDFFAICSSLASTMGLFAQSDYCAANSYQDAFAHQKRYHDNVPVISINWGIWQDTGAAMRTMMNKDTALILPTWVNHPLFEYRLILEDRVNYYGLLSIKKDWILDEHRLENKAVVPGTAYLEIARAAFQHHTSHYTFELSDVFFLEPLVVGMENDIEFLTLLEPAGDGYNFSIISGNNRMHAKGVIASLKKEVHTKHNVPLLMQVCPNLGADFPSPVRENGHRQFGPVSVGPRWHRLVQETRFGVNQGLAVISLPREYHEDLHHYRLHPAMLDMATSFALGEGAFYLPFSYGKLKMYCPLPDTFYSYARYMDDSTSHKESLSYEILFLDSEGNKCVSIERFLLRKVEPGDVKLVESENRLAFLNSGPAPQLHAELKEGMSSEEGAQAFHRAISRDLPQVLVSTQHLPTVFKRNETGRIIRSKEENLREFEEVETRIRSGKSSGTGAQQAPPAENDLTRTLTRIWQDVLGVEDITANDNFFELNGDSILAIMVSTRLRNIFQIEIAPNILFNAPTISLLAAQLEGQLNGVRELPGEEVEQEIRPGSQIQPMSEEKEEIAVVKKTGDIPLSFNQERLWFLDQLIPGAPLYNMPMALLIKGPLQVEVLRKTFREIVQRHGTLRTSFISTDGKPFQVIEPDLAIEIPLIDLTGLPEQEKGREVQRLARKEEETPFDLTRSPLLRVTLLELGQEEFVLLVTLHHIVCDGWSLGILNNEINTLYEAFSRGAPSPLPPLEIQYADFAAWQRKWLSSDVLERQLSYWKQQLKGMPPLLELPTDHPRPATQSFRGGIHWFEIDPWVIERLEQLGRQSGASLFMTLLAAFYVLLFRYSHRDDLVVGSPVANRNRREIEPLIGFFVNTLVLRIQLSGNMLFSELLPRVRQVCIDGYGNQDLPFEQLVEALQPERNFGHNSLFQVMFALQNAPMGEMKLQQLSISTLETDKVTETFDLILSFIERNVEKQLAGVLEYNRDLFEPATISRMAGHLLVLLEGVTENPKRRISQLPLLLEEERQRLVVEWNQTHSGRSDADYVHRLFEARARQSPHTIAIIKGERTISCGRLNQKANQLARYLRTHGVGPGILVAVAVEEKPEAVIALMAILKTGGVYLPLDPNYPRERLEFMIEESGAAVILPQKKDLKTFSHLPQISSKSIHCKTLFCLDQEQDIIARQPAGNLTTPLIPDNPAYVIYTSGTTGRPKGVIISHQAIATYCREISCLYELTSEDRILQAASPNFDVSLEEILSGLINGSRLVSVDPATLTPSEFSQILATFDITVAILTPAIWRHLLNHWLKVPASAPKKRLRLMSIGGDVMTPEMVKLWRTGPMKSLRLLNLYGPTEATIGSTAYNVPLIPGEDIPENGVPIGRPLADTTAYILNRYRQPVPVGVPGELYIGGIRLARGYLNRPELTHDQFILDPFSSKPAARLYKTGDRASFLPDGNIRFLGRSDCQVKVRGFRIELGEIEAVLLEHPSVKEASVIIKEMNGENRIIAYIVGDGEPESEGGFRDELKEFLDNRLPGYMMPSVFVRLECLPLTPSAKLDHRKLPAPGVTPNKDGIIPRTSLELELACIWEELLGIDKIGVTDNFFELGGHSLLAVRLMVSIEEKFGKPLPLAALFKAPTIEALAAVLRDDELSCPWSPLVPIQPKGHKPPIFCIPGVGGNVFCFYPLSRYLGLEQPIYGLQVRGVDGESSPHRSIEEMAASYLESMQTIQPEGPYRLAGHSFGGLVAFEMALRLRRIGQEVSHLILIDSIAPQLANTMTVENWTDTDWLAAFAHENGLQTGTRDSFLKENPDSLEFDTRLKLLYNEMKRNNLLVSNARMTEFQALFRVFRIHYQLRYQPGAAIDSGTILFRASEFPPGTEGSHCFGWDKHVAGSVECHDVPGDHMTVLKEPHVKILAQQIRECIK